MEGKPVPKLTAREQELLAAAEEKIRRIRRNLVSARGLTAEEAEVAAKVGLIAHDQRWWGTEEGQKGEREAERDLRADRIRGFESAEQFFQDLRSR